MEALILREREYTLSQINWNRTLTDLDLKRRKADKKERERMNIPVIEKIANPTLGFEVENFKTFGGLRKTVTEIHNTIPSYGTVLAEQECNNFEDLRRRQPHIVKYNKFGSIHDEAKKPFTPRTPSSIAISGIDEDGTSSRVRHRYNDRGSNLSRTSIFSRNDFNDSAFSPNGSSRRSFLPSRKESNKLDFRGTGVP